MELIEVFSNQIESFMYIAFLQLFNQQRYANMLSQIFGTLIYGFCLLRLQEYLSTFMNPLLVSNLIIDAILDSSFFR